MNWNFSKKNKMSEEELEELEEEVEEIEEAADEDNEISDELEEEIEKEPEPEKKNSEEDIDYEYDLDEDEEDDKDLDAYIARRHQMFKFMGIIIGGFIFIGLILYIMSLFSKPVYAYEEIEEILKDAAVEYFKEFPESLPAEDGSIVEIDSSNLVAAKKMKDLSEYKLKHDVACTGTVQVQKVEKHYVYTPYLNCGNKYLTKELYKKIIEDNDVVNSGYGLYGNNGNYVFRGENVNNYLKLDKNLWRIVKITPNNEIVLINATGYSDFQPYDDRYNPATNYNSGINNYQTSRAKEYLQKVYKDPNANKDEDILSLKDKAKMVNFDVCIGKRDLTNETKDNSVECSEVLRDQKMGLLTLSDYMYASVDPNCVNADSKSCKNYNYLTGVYEWWLVTASTENDYTAYKIEQSGTIVPELTEMYCTIRPVIHINSNVLYKSGNGTEDKPYKVK